MKNVLHAILILLGSLVAIHLGTRYVLPQLQFNSAYGFKRPTLTMTDDEKRGRHIVNANGAWEAAYRDVKKVRLLGITTTVPANEAGTAVKDLPDAATVKDLLDAATVKFESEKDAELAKNEEALERIAGLKTKSDADKKAEAGLLAVKKAYTATLEDWEEKLIGVARNNRGFELIRDANFLVKFAPSAVECARNLALCKDKEGKDIYPAALQSILDKERETFRANQEKKWDELKSDIWYVVFWVVFLVVILVAARGGIKSWHVVLITAGRHALFNPDGAGGRPTQQRVRSFREQLFRNYEEEIRGLMPLSPMALTGVRNDIKDEIGKLADLTGSELSRWIPSTREWFWVKAGLCTVGSLDEAIDSFGEFIRDNSAKGIVQKAILVVGVFFLLWVLTPERVVRDVLYAADIPTTAVLQQIPELDSVVIFNDEARALLLGLSNAGEAILRAGQDLTEYISNRSADWTARAANQVGRVGRQGGENLLKGAGVSGPSNWLGDYNDAINKAAGSPGQQPAQERKIEGNQDFRSLPGGQPRAGQRRNQ